MSRSIEALVDEQVRRWELLRHKPKEAKTRPVITVTGQHGARGDELSQKLASELGFDHFDREIIHRVADSAQLSERVVAAMDMKKRELLADWLAAFASRQERPVFVHDLDLTQDRRSSAAPQPLGVTARLAGSDEISRRHPGQKER